MMDKRGDDELLIPDAFEEEGYADIINCLGDSWE